MSATERDVAVKYGLPPDVVFCRKCVISNQRPNTVIEHANKPTDRKPTTNIGPDGACDACRYAEMKAQVDWRAREEELLDLLAKYRRTDGRPDVVVPGSGGKDSVYTAHVLREKYGMHPITVTWAPHMYTQQGWNNLQALINAGFDNVLITPNAKVHRLLTRLAFENLVHPFQPFVFGQKNVGPLIAAKFDVPLVMYGENQAEYGNPLSETSRNAMDRQFFAIEDIMAVRLAGVPVAEMMESHGIPLHDLTMYIPPRLEEIDRKGVQVHYIGYYLKFDQHDNFYYAAQCTDFRPNPVRRDGTYSRYSSLDDRIDDLHYYTTFIKFGLGKASYDAAQEIRAGHLDRDEGVALVKRFDGEFPKTHHQEVLEYMGITEERFWAVIDNARSPHLWENVGGKWRLKHAVWMDHHAG